MNQSWPRYGLYHNIGLLLQLKIFKHPQCIKLSLLREVVIAPSQTRTIPIQLEQLCAIKEELLSFSLIVASLGPSKEGRQHVVPVQLRIKHLQFWTSDPLDQEPIEFTYFSATSHPTAFLVKAPFNPPEAESSPILALRKSSLLDILLSFHVFITSTCFGTLD